VAVNDRRRNPQTGEWEDYPNFIDCVVFGNRAEPLSRFLSKGMKVAIEGKLRWSQWERDGQKRSKIEVIVDEVEFLSARQGQPSGQAPQSSYQPQGGGYQSQGQGGYQPQGSYQQPQQMPAPQQAPTYATPQQTYAPQQSPVQNPPSAEVYDEDIPF
jgi:single-strand DNA-binding protein